MIGDYVTSSGRKTHIEAGASNTFCGKWAGGLNWTVGVEPEDPSQLCKPCGKLAGTYTPKKEKSNG